VPVPVPVPVDVVVVVVGLGLGLTRIAGSAAPVVPTALTVTAPCVEAVGSEVVVVSSLALAEPMAKATPKPTTAAATAMAI
jgi:hypothetical protein